MLFFIKSDSKNVPDKIWVFSKLSGLLTSNNTTSVLKKPLYLSNFKNMMLLNRFNIKLTVKVSSAWNVFLIL
jgi:hypothetical protein